MDNTEIIHRLAKACSRGWRQDSLINELIAGDVHIRQDVWNRFYVGESSLEYRSWKNLRRRLVAVGFVVKTDYNQRISLEWKM